MTLLTWVAGLFGDTHTEPHVHFHTGPDSSPAACFDARCGSPRLDV